MSLAAAFAVLILAAEPSLPSLDIVWEAKPTELPDLPRFIPRDTRRYRAGEVQLNCRFTADGRLEDCVILKEIPADYGLGAWTLKVATLFKAAPLSKSGIPVAGRRVIIPFRFDPPAHQPPPTPEPATQ